MECQKVLTKENRQTFLESLERQHAGGDRGDLVAAGSQVQFAKEAGLKPKGWVGGGGTNPGHSAGAGQSQVVVDVSGRGVLLQR